MEHAVSAFIVSGRLVRVLEGGLAEGRLLCPAGKGAGCSGRAAGYIPKGRTAPFLQLVAWLPGQQAEQVLCQAFRATRATGGQLQSKVPLA